MIKSWFDVSGWTLATALGFTLAALYFATQTSLTRYPWIGFVGIFLFATTIVALPAVCHRLRVALFGFLMVLAGVLALVVHQHLAMLYVVICLFAIEQINPSRSAICVGLCVAAVLAVELANERSLQAWQDALINALLTMLISGFAHLRKSAETAKKEAQSLLVELEAKNLQLAKFAETQEHRGRLQERQTLSRELHDTLGHKLTTSIVQLDAAKQFLEISPGRVPKILETVGSLLTEGLAETRDMVKLIDAPELSRGDFGAQIGKTKNRFEAATGISVTLDIKCKETQIPSVYQQHLLPLLQEALTNISRHAEATQITISLAATPDITLVIKDNGKSLENSVGESLPKLKSIESRVSELGGTLDFLRAPNETIVSIHLPEQLTRDLSSD